MESPGSQGPASWEDPQCAFRIEWDTFLLDQVRIVVVDALYAVPRGGIEIGGVLLGKFDGKLLSIDDWAPMECEHLTGPSFVLSAKDQAALQLQIEALGTKVVGWFRSHTRSEIDFSPVDLSIHHQFFPGLSQIAMVLRPTNMQPVRANYFFPGPDGSMLRGASDFTLEAAPGESKARSRSNAVTAAAAPPKPKPAMPPKPNPAMPPKPVLPTVGNAIPATPQPFVPGPGVLAAAVPRERTKPGEPLKASPVKPPAPVHLPEPPRPARHKEPEETSHFLLYAALVVMLVLTVAAYFTRESWMRKSPELLKLQASDVDGKLLIRWIPIRDAQTGQLNIKDGNKSTDVTLDPLQLRQGYYVFARQAVNDTVHLKIGDREETTSFAGPVAIRRNSEPSPEQKESKMKSERQEGR